jgi:two-component system, LytTR family, sensor kinase
MPESFVEPSAPLNVGWSIRPPRARWGIMSASPANGVGGSPPAPAIPLLPGRQPVVWLLVLAGWTIVGLAYLASLVYESEATTRAGHGLGRVVVYSIGTAWIWALLTPAVLRVTRAASLALDSWTRSLLLYLAGAAGFFLASGVLEWTLGVATGMIRADQFWATLLTECVDTRLLAYLAIVMLGWSAQYFTLYRTRHLHASELETRLAKTHLQVLKMQLQPHFLFNTLNAIAELVHTDPEAADLMITRLGRLLRLSLDHAGHQVVQLRQEAGFLRVYIEIEQVRFQDRLEIVWDLAPDTLDASVPTLLLQPLLENAIRHGVTPMMGRGRIVIASRREGEDLVLELRDNGRGLPTGAAVREGVGLRNIQERLQQLYGKAGRFGLIPALGGGTLAILRLPFTPCEHVHTPVPLPTSIRELVR